MTTPARVMGRCPQDVDEAVDRLRAEGARLTAAKRLLLDHLAGATRAMTAEGLHEKVADVDIATVYRCMAQFEAAGIVVHRHDAHGPALYRWANVESLPIVCDGCGAVDEIGGADLRAIELRIRDATGMAVGRHFAFTGWCAECARAAL